MRASLCIVILLTPIFLIAQQTLEKSIIHDGIERDYIVYVPALYSNSEPVPLVFNFHGYTSNASEQMWYGDFRSIADTANFIIVHPQGELFDGNTHWNVGGWTLGSTVDDVGFTGALIDTLISDYSIDEQRIYSTGMSNGGFMSFLLACQLGERFAAIASVTGSMTPEIYNDCNPSHPTPILQIHGLDDSVVPYNGASWSKSIEDVLAYWIEYNNCNMELIEEVVPNVNMNDGSVANKQQYIDGDKGTMVEHFKIAGGDHTWPGTAFGGAGTNYDFNASEEIWRFFSRYNLGALSEVSSANDNHEIGLTIFPNPAQSKLTIKLNDLLVDGYQIIDQSGDLVDSGTLVSLVNEIDISHIPVGVYFLLVESKSVKFVKTK